MSSSPPPFEPPPPGSGAKRAAGARTNGGGRRRGRPRWIAWGALIAATIAALALVLAVATGRQTLHAASEIIARGEANAMVSMLQRDLSAAGNLTEPTLVSALERYGERGLRYVAVVENDGSRTFSSAGSARIAQSRHGPGDVRIEHGRVRLVDWVAPKEEDRGRPPPGPPPVGPFAPDPAKEPPTGPPLLVVELDTPVSQELESGMRRMVLVSGFAVVALVAFAVAWLRGTRRVEEMEKRAEHERRLVALGEMSSVIAHELRNPLTALKGHAQLLAETMDGDARARAKADRVVREAERIELLTTNLLEFVREGPLEWQAVEPAALVARALEGAEGAARVQIDLAAAPAALELDPARAVRAIRNLVDNALALGAPHEVELSIAARGGEVEIEVRDRGPGLPPDVGRMFEPFVTTRTRGTGLGLAIARRIVEQHGGRLRAFAREGGGARFVISLPQRQRGG